MFQIITKTVTFTNGVAVILGAITDAPARCAKIFIEPANANTHVMYVGDASLALGTSAVDHVLRTVAKPTATDGVLDAFVLESQNDKNNIATAQFSVDGTTSEKCRVTF